MIFTKRSAIAAILTFAYCMFVLPINEQIAFSTPTDKQTIIRAYLLKLFFAIFLYCLLYFVITFAVKIKERDKDYLRWLKYAGIYFGIMLVFLALVYPGNWLWDEFLILRQVAAYSTYSWQHYFTNVYYTFSLYLIPTGAAIVWLQLGAISLIVGYIVNQCRVFFRNKTYALFMFVPFFFLPVIFYNLYPLRLTIYSYIEVLVLFNLIVIHFRPEVIKGRLLMFTGMAFLVTLLAFWRTEGLYYLLVLPYVVYKLRLFHDGRYRRVFSYALLIPAAAIIVIGYTVTKATAIPSYQLSATLNPLSTMLQHKLQGSHVAESLRSIDKVVDLQFLKANPDNFEVPVFWYDNTIRPDYKKHIPEYNRAALYLISRNPGLYFENRIRLFLATNSLYPHAPHVGEGGLRFFDTRPDRKEVVDYFLANNRLVRPIHPALKQKVTRAFLGVNSQVKNTWLAPLIWSLIPTAILLIALAVWKAMQRSYFWVVLCALVLARFALLFITSPASYFMYYLPFYISGNFLLAFAALQYLDKDGRIVQVLKDKLLYIFRNPRHALKKNGS